MAAATEKLWALARAKDFDALVTQVMAEGVGEQDLGETLFALARQALAGRQFEVARGILFFLVKALEESSEDSVLLKLIGDTYAVEGAHAQAREFYGRLPVTLDNVRLCLRTFVPALDIAGLLKARDEYVAKLAGPACSQIHGVVHELMLEVAAFPSVRKRHADQFARNMGYLEQICPASIAPLVDGEAGNRNCLRIGPDIFEFDNGVWQQYVPRAPKSRFKREQFGTDTPVVFRCPTAGILSELVEALQTEKPSFYKTDCYLITDFRLLREWLSVCDLSPLASCDFVFRLVDEARLRQDLRHLLLERRSLFPTRISWARPEDHAFIERQVVPVLEECSVVYVNNLRIIEQRMAEFFPDTYGQTVKDKIRAKEPLRVLLLTSRFSTYLQYCTRDMAEGFRRLGHAIEIDIEDDDAGAGTRYDVIPQRLCDFRPDIIFCIDHVRHEVAGLPKSVPFVTWVQDFLPSMTDIGMDKAPTENDHIFCYNQRGLSLFSRLQPYARKKIHLLPIPLNPNVYYPLDTAKEYDVTYVSHLWNPEQTLQPFREGRAPEDVTDAAEIIFWRQTVKELDALSIREIWRMFVDHAFRRAFVTQVCRKCGLQYSEHWFSELDSEYERKGVLTRFYIDFHFSAKLRPIRYLHQQGIGVRVFGKNWEKIDDLRSIAMGPVANGPELNALINRTRINLNLSTETSYHMKVPEVMGSKSFLISRHIEDDSLPITSIFTEGTEAILFRDEQDLLAKVHYYLAHEGERQAIAERAYRKITAEHTYAKAAAKIIEVVGDLADGRDGAVVRRPKRTNKRKGRK